MGRSGRKARGRGMGPLWQGGCAWGWGLVDLGPGDSQAWLSHVGAPGSVGITVGSHLGLGDPDSAETVGCVARPQPGK